MDSIGVDMPELQIMVYTMGENRMVECEELNIFEAGDTFEEAFKNFGEALDHAIYHYGNTPRDTLKDEEIELRDFLMVFLDDMTE